METKEAVRLSVVEESNKGGGSLVLRPAQMGIARGIQWTQENIDLLKRTVTPKECTDDEFKVFLEQCRHTGLNPFLKQAYMMERSANVQDAKGNWVCVKHFEFQAAEIGMAARANEFPDFRGMRGAAVYSKDPFEMDPVANVVTLHKFSPNKDRGVLMGAWAAIHRDGHFVPMTYLKIESRIQRKKDGSPNKFWKDMPDGQIEKCARAEQYRRGYPHIFSGVFIPEEMPEELEAPTQANGQPYVVQGEVVQEPPKPAPTPQKVAQAVAQRVQELRKDEAERITMGTRAGTKLVDLTADELSEMCHKASQWLKNERNKDSRPQVEAELAKLRKEMDARVAELAKVDEDTKAAAAEAAATPTPTAEPKPAEPVQAEFGDSDDIPF